MHGCDVVFHLAAAATVMGCEAAPEPAHTINVTGTYNVLEAAKRSHVQRVVFASSREVYGEPLQLPVAEHTPLKPKNAYGASKSAAEMYCSWYASIGMEVTTLRLANVFGSGDSGRAIPIFLERAAAGNPITVYGGTQVIDFVPVRVVIDGFMRAAFGPYVNGCVNVGSGVGNSLLETAERIRQHCGSASKIIIAPARPAEVCRFVADTTRARSELRLDLPIDPLAEIEAIAPFVALGADGESTHAVGS
jgi:UDP-glucose 4-epimerase